MSEQMREVLEELYIRGGFDHHRYGHLNNIEHNKGRMGEAVRLAESALSADGGAVPAGWADAHNLARNVAEGCHTALTPTGERMLAQAILDMDEIRKSAAPQAPTDSAKQTLSDAMSLHGIMAAQTPQEHSEAIYLVATGIRNGGEKTYTRHEGKPPPLCDFEGPLFAAPTKEARKPLTDADIDSLDTFSLGHMAPRGKGSVREFARVIEARITSEGKL